MKISTKIAKKKPIEWLQSRVQNAVYSVECRGRWSEGQCRVKRFFRTCCKRKTQQNSKNSKISAEKQNWGEVLKKKIWILNAQHWVPSKVYFSSAQFGFSFVSSTERLKTELHCMLFAQQVTLLLQSSTSVIGRRVSYWTGLAVLHSSACEGCASWTIHYTSHWSIVFYHYHHHLLFHHRQSTKHMHFAVVIKKQPKMAIRYLWRRNENVIRFKGKEKEKDKENYFMPTQELCRWCHMIVNISVRK